MSYRHLSLGERIQISSLLKVGKNLGDIALSLGRSKGTISREIRRNDSPEGYFPHTAQILSMQRHSAASLDHSMIPNQLKTWVISKIKLKWSPDQISGRAELEGKGKVSHEWIYQLISKDKKNEGGLYLHLRHGAKKRKKRYGSHDRRGQIKNRVGIDKRPKIVEKRKRPLDLEGDLINGAKHRGNLVTVADRVSLLVQIKTSASKDAVEVERKITNIMKGFGVKPKTLTLDNGKEFSRHVQISEKTGVPIYFCHPYSSFERGTIENMNGLIRQYFPKGTDLSSVTSKEVKQVEKALNQRPRKSLNYKTPQEFHFSKT